MGCITELSPEELKQAIAYELAKYVPLLVNDVVWSARIVPGEAGDEHSCRGRVVFMLRDKWEKFVSELQIRGLKVKSINKSMRGYFESAHRFFP